MTEQTPEHPAVLELARVRAGLAAGLSVAQSARLQGATPEELAADAASFATELNAANPTTSGPLVGGSRGTDVGSATGVAAGAAEYERKHPKREPIAAPTEAEQRRNPFQTSTYEMETR
ncbi:hypothetical protein [Streptomyces bobili]|uniref:hypothetical protein n=1 Tax=Streptomyces bobili TaxID=67280 RepID=UPI000A369EE4|nr:hypothetical protein [Streptomyces bobili]